MEKRGFTLVELVISIAILATICALGMVALQSASTSSATAKSKAEAQDNVRDALAAMQQELQIASKRTDTSLIPPLNALAVTPNPVLGSPVQVTFQVPADTTGNNWSRPITFRYINEDANGDGRLTAGEDTDSDGVLSRRIVRIQDLNGNGSTNDAGETTEVGGANDLSNVTFAFDGNVLTVTLTSTKLIGLRRTNPATVTVTTDIYLEN
ncbi:MAG: type II secretion system GspH family protein [Candidatus Hydrogenedentes bacterium]|nr:type II secretion system GspH family protein [Candidatus Hydrogenedentota bacterium]